MIEILKYNVGPLASNAYVLVKGKNAIIIDLGGDGKTILAEIEKRGLSLKAILLTHAHFDHILGAAEIQSKTKIYVHSGDAEMLNDGEKNLSCEMNISMPHFENFEILNEGIFNIDGFTIEVIHTPGHTLGSVCYKIDDMLFTGDTLFFCSYGRTDFYGGSDTSLKHSLQKLFSIKENLKVYSGHGENTTLAFERENNPIND